MRKLLKGYRAFLFKISKEMPKVSVIIPNYNHAKYLPARIESVLNQTFSDFELIILDDFSTDNSREVIEKYAKENPKIRCEFNTKNSGSPFYQWNKGVEMAKAEYIWLAESDDVAENDFLETLVPILDKNSKVGISYSRSNIIDEDGNQVDKIWKPYYKTEKWEKDFIENGFVECNDLMILGNLIPNASAVLFRKSVFIESGKAPTKMKLSGDWSTWFNMMLISDLAYVAKKLNHWRQHSQSVRDTQYSSRKADFDRHRTQYFMQLKVKTSKEYRRKLFKELSKEIILFSRENNSSFSFSHLFKHLKFLPKFKGIWVQFYPLVFKELIKFTLSKIFIFNKK